MIQKMSSKDIMDLLSKSQDSITDVRNNINKTKEGLANKLRIVQNMQEYEAAEFRNIQEKLDAGAGSVKDILVFGDESMDGMYNRFGTTIHPAFVKSPHDIFNLSSVTGKIFKGNMNVRLNDTLKEEYKNMLMDDSISNKGVTFEEFDTDTVTMNIEVNLGDLIGDTSFNIMEIVPYIPGSLSIESIELYTIEDAQASTSTPSFHFYREIPSIGSCRIMLDQTRKFYNLFVTFKLNFRNSNGKYPFGLKHLYFLKGDYNPDSKVVVKIEENDYIDWISEDIVVHDQNGVYDSTLKDEGIKLYMTYTNGALSYEIAPSHGLTQNVIPRNIKSFYASIPVKRSMTSIRFKKIATRS